ncbi:ATP-dependent DNA helicase DinG [Desulfotomaculum arcticum]|uniref:ATP-dependent DNA helicase DinG n=1 Tax=Desulfotruncus arcticus DSM 17038 TaxID=1121424 RepID=A0A1I2XHL2_9FIRM|nr:ATP-dependent DNA helicase [Desulfotruncus arcticus]SFH12970.1 ATP-dependent DNA helicase DinG [Desulfotomaculum arcticum] [Desulfotruncus arcticus DSM 17038]
MCAVRSHLPFAYQSKHDFPVKLTEWIGQVFYDVLPEHGYEIREEQIYTAFKLADAACRGKVHFAEAGLGIGKTFAYLLTAVAYARLKGKPVVIACASTALQEQLAGPRGDIEKLSRLLDLDIDVRMAKDPHQYICDIKVNRFHNLLFEQPGKAVTNVLHWAGKTERGERSEMPGVPDRVWTQVAWDETMPCETCPDRGFCKLVKAREHYRSALDLVVCDHGTFFDDLWTRDERVAEGKLPLLPDYSAVIFDEGHKILLPAALRAGRQVVKEDIDDMLTSIEQIQGARTSLISIAFAMDKATARFFKILYQAAAGDEQTDRLTIRINDELLGAADTLRRALGTLHFELQNEQDLHLQTLSHTRLQAYEAGVERAALALDRFCRNRGKDVIFWADRLDQSFWVVPRDLSGMLNKHLFARRLPVVFSSATMSTGGDFSYFARALGLKEFSSSSVGSSFEFDKQVLVYLPQRLPAVDQQSWFPRALRRLVSLLRVSKGRALVLTNRPSDVRKIRKGLKEFRLPFEFLWEDSAERGYLVRKFREEISSVLVGSGFWEGIDVPGEALSLLVIWQLPFPPQDPLIEARRREMKEQGLDPVSTVDYPEMGLRLKQGCGRLIRSRDDRGAIVILEPVPGRPWEQHVLGAFPAGAKVVQNLSALSTLWPGSATEPKHHARAAANVSTRL